MLKSITIFVALALAAAALVAGCGGSDEATASKPPTKAEFMKKAESVCAKAKATRFNEGAAYRKDHEKELNALEPIPAEEKIIRAIVLPSVTKQAEELKAIGAPKRQEKKIAAIVAAIEAGVKGAEKNPYAIELEVPAENPFKKADALIRTYGFQVCRNVP
jgi:hypothetical protein